MKHIKMTMIFLGAVGMFVLVGCSNAGNEQSGVAMVEECHANNSCEEFVSGSLSPKDFKEKLDSGEYELIDIRTQDEYMNERIADVANIDIYKESFNDTINHLDKDKKYLIYCRSGNRTKMALNRMKAYGFKEVYDLDGGINAWKEAGYPIIGQNNH